MRFYLGFQGRSCAIIAQIQKRRADFARWVWLVGMLHAGLFPKTRLAWAMTIGF
jgi:hypothetical protein